jgi:two-component system cell cycle sensor histidine kinase/response regulator CckA
LLSFPRNFDYSRVNRVRVLLVCGIGAAMLALLDIKVFHGISLGFLYIIPLAIASGFLTRWQILGFAASLAILRELGSPLPWFGDYLPHLVMTAVAFSATGFLIKELAVNQRYMRERAQYLEQRRELEDQLRHSQRLEAVGRLAGGIAHDFNNLLSVIIGYSDFALAKAADGELRRDIEQIRKSADRAALLTRQLLVFSRRQKIEPRRIDLNELISNLNQMLRRVIGEDIDLQLELQPGLPMVLADAGQMEQVLMNLTLNARDAMPDGGKLVIETADLEIEHAGSSLPPQITPGRYVRITVSDNGIGMDKNTQEHIFEPFFTTKEVGKGTGLGLSVVYGLVRQNNGHVWFHSAPGEGASFYIYLPITQKESAEVESERAQRKFIRSAGSGSVLLVEDYAPVRSLAAEILKNHGYAVVAVSNAEEALAAARRAARRFDLLLTDVVMPGKGGRELAADLQRESPTTKVLYMTGYSGDGVSSVRELPSGAVIIQKPFTSDSLIHAVEVTLGRAKAQPHVRDGEAGGEGEIRTPGTR